MTKILVDLSDDEDKIVEVYKVVNSLKSKQEAIKQMVRYFTVSVRPKNIGKNEEYYKRAIRFSGDE
jgi:hypothetical protein